VNNGVQESPPSASLSNGNSSAKSGPDPRSLFINLRGANVSYHHWHPVSVSNKGDQLCGQSDMGGVWEWTSTVLEKHEGFEPMSLYPGYTSAFSSQRAVQSHANVLGDFFDGKHNVTLGGSWATHPRLAGRKTL
jgi:formylglycine-generating enzyme required for sulfatase activity